MSFRKTLDVCIQNNGESIGNLLRHPSGNVMSLPVNKRPESIQTHDWIQPFDPNIEEDESIIIIPDRKWTIEEDRNLLEKYLSF
jgi:hypothetical protein